MAFFDTFLAKVSAEDKAILDKYPELKASVDNLETQLGQAQTYGQRWQQWSQENWDPQAGMTVAERELREQLAAMQARGETGAAEAAQIAALKKEVEDRQKASDAQMYQMLAGMGKFYSEVTRRAFDHQNEFHENLDPDKFREYIDQNFTKKNLQVEPAFAYDQWVAGRRREIAAQAAKDLETKHAADLEAARQDERNKIAQERAMGPAGVLPTDSTGGIAGITAQMENKPAVLSDEVKARVAAAKPGDGSLAALGYELYRTGQLPVQ